MRSPAYAVAEGPNTHDLLALFDGQELETLFSIFS